MKQQIAQLQEGNKQAVEKYEATLAQMKIDHALEGYLRDQKAKNHKAVLGLLDLTGIKLDGDKLFGIDEQVAALKKSDPYLFAEAEQPGGGGANPAGAGDKTTLQQIEAAYEAAIKAGKTAEAVALKNKIFSMQKK